jgi:hypothetical protein
LCAAALCAPIVAFSTAGADSTNAPAAAAAQSFKKPAWLSELSFGMKESFDNNIYMSGTSQQFAPAGLISVKERSSFVTTASPKAAFNFIPLLGDQKVFDTLTFSYAPDFVTYHGGEGPNAVPGFNASDESYTNHRLVNGFKGKTGNFSYGLDNTLNYIDGDKEGAIFPGDRSAYATAITRERKAQIQDRSKVVLRYDQDKWFLRPTASLLYYDFLTRQRSATGTATGYQNYADRYDVNGGIDFGYKATSTITPTLGYRYGHQEQESYFFDPKKENATSDYHRILAGVEGKPLKWLKLELQGGPDFRSYVKETVLNDHDPVKYYGEASIAAEISPKDALTFKYKQYQWVSSTGKIPYSDSNFELSYRRKITSKLQGEILGRVGDSDYAAGNSASGLRDDSQYTIGTSLRYAFNSVMSAELAYSMDLGVNQQDKVVNPQNREYERHLVSMGVQLKF